MSLNVAFTDESFTETEDGFETSALVTVTIPVGLIFDRMPTREEMIVAAVENFLDHPCIGTPEGSAGDLRGYVDTIACEAPGTVDDSGLQGERTQSGRPAYGGRPGGCMTPQEQNEMEALQRRALVAINAQPGERELLEQKHGQVWDGSELGRDFEVLGFGAPVVVVRRRSDGVTGSLFFQHSPRFYFDFHEDRGQ